MSQKIAFFSSLVMIFQRAIICLTPTRSSKYFGKFSQPRDLRQEKLSQKKLSLRERDVAGSNWPFDKDDGILLYYATLPTQERVAGNATSIPRPSEKRLDTSEAPNTEG